MVAQSPVFQNFWLPNATTWFYFSLLLAVALFFKFSRLFSVRNWDVVTIFLLVPGILLIEDAQPTPQQKRLAAVSLTAEVSTGVLALPATGMTGVIHFSDAPVNQYAGAHDGFTQLWWGAAAVALILAACFPV